MKGFDPKFRDFPDYILGITQEIWEGRGLGDKMRAYYHPQVIVRMPGGISFGEAASTAATMSTLVEFPDRVLLGEDVIWSGNPEVGMLSSHRILSTATHAGSGAFGPATGRPVRYRAIADCYAKNNQISDEWLIRDNGAVIRQLGGDVVDWARERVAAFDPDTQPFRPEVDVIGPYTGTGNSNEWGEALADVLRRIMAAELSVIPAQYDRACHLEYPGGQTAHGTGGADAFWLGLRAAFPSAEFAVHHQIGMAEPLMPPRAAVRWSLTGRHDGWGAFGRPTGARVHVMGITHAEFGPNGLRREWTLYDETAIWMQILQHTG
ncbi:ester cyclase [Aestuariicoccus sp. MJ-SS9]|uniref:nuclear transport factor 2 family protein n=1 Tax=Aestuariicoccus sp. MJ-SS9 TaxID=3079855 RepID=UPI002910DEE2|nr:ester cyclase [Aestuariicoccus sp. MJ-SS9]MDU8910274.1 ester cyclase [Aestuariicoccus sp. MJ-SS9]